MRSVVPWKFGFLLQITDDTNPQGKEGKSYPEKKNEMNWLPPGNKENLQ